MSAKSQTKSKVLLNNDISSEEEMVSELDSEAMVEDLDDINAGNDSDFQELGLNLEESDVKTTNTTNTSWADAMNRVLSVKTKNKSFILSKAKKDNDLKRKSDEQNDGLEVVKSDGTVVKSLDKSNKKIKTNESNDKKKSKRKISKNVWEVLGKLKPKPEDRERERILCSVATKGVVQLFNAVKEQQKTIETKIKEIGSSETKRDKMLTQFNKNQFLDKLKQKDNSNKDKKTDESDKKDKTDGQKWKVLRDDFMIGAKMKDWDKESDSDEESVE